MLHASRAPLPVALLTALAIVLAGALALVSTDLLRGPSPAGAPPIVSQVPPPVAPAVLAPAAGTPLPAPAALARALAPRAADPAFGGRLAGIVLGVDGVPRYARRAQTLLPPASTAKLATAVAALSALPPSARLTTAVLRRGGTVVLVGGGDPTLASPAAARADPTLASLDALAAATARKLLATGTRTVSLSYDISRYAGPRTGPGWKPGYVTGGDVSPVVALMVDEGRVRPNRRARNPDPAAVAAAAFGARLVARGITVRGRPQPAPVAATASGAELAAVSSPPVPDLVARMLTASDNDIAEALGREVAGRAGLPRSFAGAAAAIGRAVSAAAGTRGEPGLALRDASGLSPLDRATPAALAALLVAAASRPALHPIFAGLPVAGFSGTLSDRFRHGPAAAAAGVVRAKTGTLSVVSALAGIVVDRAGVALTFAFLAPNPGSRTRAEAALDRLAAALANQ